VRILLDTHCWLWSYFEPEKLNARAVTILEDLDYEVFFSIASSWEIAIKYQIPNCPACQTFQPGFCLRNWWLIGLRFYR